jgi:hypothetical protein
MKKLLIAVALVVALTFNVQAASDVFSVVGTPGGTVRVAASDVTQTLTTAVTGTIKPPRAVLITVETYDVRISFVNSAVQTGSSEVGHVVSAGSSFWVNSTPAYNNIKFINKTNGSNSILQITYFY